MSGHWFLSMAKRFILVLGGARSGKSDFALKLARDIGGRVVFLATAQAHDDEMRERIAVHQQQRLQEWRTIEEPLNVADALGAQARNADVVLVDCVTLWVANLLAAASPAGVDEPDVAATADQLASQLGALHDWYRSSSASLILVSNEVGMGLVPPYPSGRAFRDLLGGANQRLATLATEAYLLIAGMPVELKQLAARPWRQDEPYDNPRR